MSKNREQWLEEAVELLAPMIEVETGPFKHPRVSVGFGPSRAHGCIGWCMPRTVAEDDRPQVFISPVLAEKMTHREMGVLPTLLHECCHAALNPGVGHKKPFARLAEKVGLLPPWTATSAGPELEIELLRIAEELGEFPHAPVTLDGDKKQTTRMLKCECLESGYVCRTTKKWLDELGAPICPCHEKRMDYEAEEE